MRQNERDIQFNVDAYTAKLIGRENVSKLEGAVLEIIKNAYDADAKVVCLYYSKAQQCIYVLDNGTGMRESVLRDHWMSIGNSSKKKNFVTDGERIQTGAKGIGRFALDRISDRCEMLIISETGGLEWTVNWDDFNEVKKLSDVKAKLYDTDETLLGYVNISKWKNHAAASIISKLDLGHTGTVFRLYGLHDEWNSITILYFKKITVSKDDAEKFYYKDIKGRRNLTKEFGGIKIYRDHFRVRPYGEYGDNNFDWLELASRLRRSPAGLGHQTNNWRVASEQIIGTVDISRENTNLDDAANRNGIQEGAGFEQLKRILLIVIKEFERDRRSIGRKLAQYKKNQDKLQKEIQRMRELAEERRKWEAEEKEQKGPEMNPEEVFDTEGDDKQKVERFCQFINMLIESAEVFRTRQEEKKQQYLELFEKRRQGGLSLKEEEEYIRLYKVLSSYGMIESLPDGVLTMEFEENR
ncbi:MAG: hypothetical protein HFG41_12250 [Coprococcus sp.]|nr:hypothetical protein [Coprococcus sp.]